jgi:cytochrome P450
MIFPLTNAFFFGTHAESTRRAALKPFTFSDGTTVHVGEWACTPVRAIMQSAEHYPEPLRFHGFRFVDQATLDKLAAAEGLRDSPRQSAPAKLTDVDSTWLVWGTGRMKWCVTIPRFLLFLHDSCDTTCLRSCV